MRQLDGLFYRACSSGCVRIVEKALKAGANANWNCSNTTTGLMVSAFYGHTDIVKLLLEAGVEVNAKSGAGNTALTFALTKKQTEIATLLQEAGAK